MTTVVISQPMFFPWVGLFEQIRLADVYVHYDDVQFSKGGFTNRVQIWNGSDVGWLTVPLQNTSLKQEIRQVETDQSRDWRRKHLTLLKQAYARAPHVDDMLAIVEAVFAAPGDSIADVSMASIEAV